MSVSADLLRNHLAYSAWASQRLLDAVAQIPSGELTRDFQTADRTVIGTLAHVFAADRIWLARVTGATSGEFITDADRQLPVLQKDWPELHARWQQWAGQLTDESVRSIVEFKDTKGNPHRLLLWQIILHVVNHGTHHRGQVSGFLRTMGHTPPPLDLSFFYREQAAHA
jgi:uncharacterized damage-inducible protein DinB